VRKDPKVQIAGELCTVLKRLGVDAESLAIVGSGRDTLGKQRGGRNRSI
jgi:hypothetical protein